MIDEKKLIEDIEKEIEFAMKCNMPAMVAGMRQIASVIEEQPKIGEWIPCSERLPDAGKRYLVSVIWKDKDFEKSAVYDAVYGSDGLWHSYNYEHVSYKVIAWQPLPEPYQQKGE